MTFSCKIYGSFFMFFLLFFLIFNTPPSCFFFLLSLFLFCFFYMDQYNAGLEKGEEIKYSGS